MAKFIAWLLLGILVFGFSVYNPNSIISSEQQASIQASIPSGVNRAFSSVFNPGGTISSPATGGQKLGKVDCTSDIQCQASYPSYTNPYCDTSTGYCMSST